VGGDAPVWSVHVAVPVVHVSSLLSGIARLGVRGDDDEIYVIVVPNAL
jgi:hypothetical protein